MQIKYLLNAVLIKCTGYQLTRPDQTIHFEGAMKRRFDNDFILESKPHGKILDIGGRSSQLLKRAFF